ncbi:MAG: ABC transporter transmembrane domain-containing protein [Methyloligellaceae bacterium]
MANQETITVGARSKSIRPLLTLQPYIFRYKLMLIGAGVALLAAALSTLVLPVGARYIIDMGFSTQSTQFIDDYFFLMVLLGAVLAVSSAARYYCVNWLGERIIADVRDDVFRHLTTLSQSFYAKTHSGELMSRLSADTTQIKSVAGTAASQALRNLVMLVGAVIMMFLTSSKLSILVVVAIPLIVLPLIAYGRIVRKLSRHAQDMQADASAYANENLSAIQTLQAFTHEKTVVDRFSRAVDASFDAAGARMRARAGLTAIVIFLVFASVVAILWVGAQEVLAGNMSGGTLGQFVLYSVFAAGSLGVLSEVWGEIQQAAGAAERLAELLETRSEIKEVSDPKELPENIKGAISFENVSFTYPSRNDVSVLDGVSLDIKPGETVAIVGPSGAGKSTIFNLLLRFYDPAQGQIKIDGLPIHELKLNSLRSSIALVSQDTALFSETILENIRYGTPEAPFDKIKEAADIACASEFIDALPHGFSTRLGEKGMSLSGGQRQRLAIARAVLKKSPILLLDEATSALDAENEKLVQVALERVMEKRTTIVIAHRLSTVQRADRILVMDRGQIVEVGNHQSLLAKDGVYARLARLQFSSEQVLA